MTKLTIKQAIAILKEEFKNFIYMCECSFQPIDLIECMDFMNSYVEENHYSMKQLYERVTDLFRLYYSKDVERVRLLTLDAEQLATSLNPVFWLELKPGIELDLEYGNKGGYDNPDDFNVIGLNHEEDELIEIDGELKLKILNRYYEVNYVN